MKQGRGHTRHLHSASLCTRLRRWTSSFTTDFLRSFNALASRARPSRSLLQASEMRRILCRISGMRVGSPVGVQEFNEMSARDVTSCS